MSTSVTLFTDRAAFEATWRQPLEQLGMMVTVSTPDALSKLAERRAAVVVDAASELFDEDELLTTLGFARATGSVAAAYLPRTEAMASIDDVVDELCEGLVARSDSDVARVATALARRNDRTRSKRFEFVTVSPRENEVLAIMGDGQAALMRRPLTKNDDGSEVVTIALADDASSATLELVSGNSMMLRATTVPPHPATTTNGGNGIMLDGAKLGARLRELRLAAGLTQAELARRTGIHRPNIARVEAGRHTPSLDTLSRLATAIGVSTTSVLSEE